MADTFTYDVSTPVGKVRFNVGDIDLTETTGLRENWTVCFTDEEILYALEESGDDKNIASYRLLLAIASNRALLSKRMRTSTGTESETSNAVKDLRELAKTYLEASMSEGPIEEITPVTWDDFTYRQRIGYG